MRYEIGQSDDERYPRGHGRRGIGAAVTLRRAQTVILSVLAGMFIISGGFPGTALAQAIRTQAASATTAACAKRPATAAKDTAAVSTTPRSSASAAPSKTVTASPTPKATPTATATPSASPSASKSPTPSATVSPTPTPTPTPTPKPTPTPTPTPSPSPTPKAATLCVSVAAFSNSKVHPGGTASYAIWVWTTGADAAGVTVTATVAAVAHVGAAQFSVCSQHSGDVCTVGTLPTGQSDELEAVVKVGAAAAAGKKITLTATAKGTKATAFDAAATVDIVAAPKAKTSPAPSTPASTLPAESLPPLPFNTVGGTTLTSPTDPSGLFPTVSPSSSTSAVSSTADPGKKDPKRSDTTTVSAILPLNSRLVGGQLAGLVVLAIAIAIAIARLSLRTPRPHDGGGTPK